MIELSQANSYPCRECGEVFTEESGAVPNPEQFTCDDCISQLEDNVKNATLTEVLNNIREETNPNNFIEHIDIEDKIECALWCGMQFEKMKDEYLEMGHANESYEGFLVQTYVSTKESMPESIADELAGRVQ